MSDEPTNIERWGELHAHIDQLIENKQPVDEADLQARFPDIPREEIARAVAQAQERERCRPFLVRPRPLELPDTFGRYTFPQPRVIRQGGMNAVYLVQERIGDHLVRAVALKMPLDSLRSDPRALPLFRREEELATTLRHRCVLPLLDRGEWEGTPFYTMPWLERCQTLSSAWPSPPDGPREVPARLELLAQVCEAVAYLHDQGWVHLDLKPDNLMVGDPGEVYIIDLGCAHRVGHEEDRARAGEFRLLGDSLKTSFRGTPAYMAPEQAQGEPVGRPADCFALGGLLVFLHTWTGVYPTDPFAADPLARARKCDTTGAAERLRAAGADVSLQKLAERCLRRNPAERPSAQQIARELREHIAGLQEAKTRASRRAAVWGWSFAAAVFLLAILGGALVWQQGEYDRLQRQDRARTQYVARGKESAAIDQQVADLDITHPSKAREAVRLCEQQVQMEAARQEIVNHSELVEEQGPVAERVQVAQGRLAQMKRLAGLLQGLDEAAQHALLRCLDVRPNYPAAAQHYAKTFQGAGFNLFQGQPATVAHAIRQLDRRVYLPVIQALDDWRLSHEPDRERLEQVLALLDNDPWRQRLRRAEGAAAENLAQLADQFPAGAPPRYLAFLGRVLLRRGEIPQALQVLERARFQHRGDVWLQLELAMTYCHATPARWADATSALHSAVNAAPLSVLAVNDLAVSLMRRGELVEAERWLAEAEKLRPDSQTVQENRALLNLVARLDVGAARQLLPDLRAGKDNVRAQALLALALVLTNQEKEAAPLLEVLLQRLADEPLAAAPLLLDAVFRQDAVRLRALAGLFGRHHPHLPIRVLLEAGVLLEEGRASEADQLARAGLAQLGDAGILRCLLLCTQAQAALDLGQLDRVEKLLAAARRDHPAWYPAELLRLDLFDRQSRFAEQLELGRRLQKQLGPGNRVTDSLKQRETSILLMLAAEADLKKRQQGAAGSVWHEMHAAEIALLRKQAALAVKIYDDFPDNWIVRGQASPTHVREGFTHRFNAARAAVLLLTGRDASGVKIAGRPRAELHAHARRWLQEELQGRKSGLSVPGASVLFRRWLHYCQHCGDFEGLRDSGLEQLPGCERADWRLFWREVDVQLKALASQPEKGAVREAAAPLLPEWLVQRTRWDGSLAAAALRRAGREPQGRRVFVREPEAPFSARAPRATERPRLNFHSSHLRGAVLLAWPTTTPQRVGAFSGRCGLPPPFAPPG